MKQYMTVAPDGRVDGLFDREDDEAPPVVEGFETIEVPEPFVGGWPVGSTSTEVLYWIDNAFEWIETAPLADRKAASIAKTFTDVDAVIWDAVGNRTREYELSEQAARAFAAAGYEGPVSRLVSAYAINNPTLQVQTNEWAAQNIIARANAFDWATEEMRDQRMAHGVRMQSAETSAELATAVTAWLAFIAGLRAQLGL